MSERVVVVNAGKMNYDHALDFSVLSSDVQVYDNSTNEELIDSKNKFITILNKL